MNLKMDDNDGESVDRVKEATARKTAAKYEPTWAEVWDGNMEQKVKGIWTMHNSDADVEKLKQVKAAVESGEIGTMVESLRNFSKAHALRLYTTLTASRRDSILRQMVAETPANYRLIQTEDELEQLVADLWKENLIGLDTETTGLDVFADEIVGLSISLPIADYHVYIPVAHNTGRQLPRDYVLNRLDPILSAPNIHKVLHNAKFDVHMFIRHGIRLRGPIHDTRIRMALLSENEPTYALKHLATKYGTYFGFQAESYTFEQLFGKTRFDEVALDVALVYAAKDTHLTLKLFMWQEDHFRKRPALLRLYEEMEQPIIEVCVDMEQAGFLIDVDFAKEYGEELRYEIEGLSKSLAQHFGAINFNSPAQLAAKLYDDLDLPEIDGRSTDMKTLKALKGKHPGIADLLKYRELSKLLGTYVDALPNMIKSDGRIHGSFNQVATVTGRFSANEPNLQNLPPRARRLIVAPPGKVIVGIDFSQIEPRVLAHMSGDRQMQEPYKTAKDLYSSMAARVFKVGVEECGDGSVYRKKMKVGLLACMYGITVPSLADSLGISVEEAEQFFEDFYAAYLDVGGFIQDTHEFVKQHEYVEMMDDRKRRFPGHKQKATQYDALAAKICQKLGTTKVPRDFWQYKDELPYKLKRDFQDVKGDVERVRRMAVNARIQGTAAGILKTAMIRTHAYVKSKGWETLATIHDEILFLVEETITRQEIEEMEALMVGSASLDIPLKVDTELFTRWGEGVKKEKWFANVAV